MPEGEALNGPLCCAAIDHAASAADVLQELEMFLHGLHERHAAIHQEIKGLTEELLGHGLRPCLNALREKCQQLETTFHAIDQLQQTMDQINQLILTVHATLKPIDTSPDVVGKASSLLASFGFALKSERANAGLWSRVPSYAMLESRTPKEFLEGMHTVFAPLCSSENP
ncbi:hypothetical protein DQ04_00081180 [Trypanosoma grayi]|uniref:hypothetical protein n=1 Tax=Trypanosoma grayi TaxID=71804 RepID=UPI0004F4ABE5|nr:hypothetical protein DQ04_00081180 [Trypanosoma grayi]KEG15419.1 hypothetical protein DQ04_00081180 [Trypanosoma grayi]